MQDARHRPHPRPNKRILLRKVLVYFFDLRPIFLALLHWGDQPRADEVASANALEKSPALKNNRPPTPTVADRRPTAFISLSSKGEDQGLRKTNKPRTYLPTTYLPTFFLRFF
jgi:hypothetical protein